MHYTVNNANLNDSGLLSGCLYTDTDDAQKHPTMKLISAVTNYKRGADVSDNVDLSILTYKNSRRPIPLNDYENPNYFMLVFSTLFSFGIEGHLGSWTDGKTAKNSLQT